MKIALADNRDSFVHNICGLLERVSPRCQWTVVPTDVLADSPLDYDALILSPGPGLPQEMPGLMRLVEHAAGSVPMLGVCLGMQAIAIHFGAHLRQLPCPRHGHRSPLTVTDHSDPLLATLKALPSPPHVGRYHSWIVDPSTLPATLVATSRDEEGNIMSLRHRTLPLFGLQFHPESVMTDCGLDLLAAFLRLVASRLR